jgi:periplasmic divalent cation tolerance protein
MNNDCCIVITSLSDDANGQKIIDALFAERLAACVQVMPIQSMYQWQGQLCHTPEKLVLIKTKRSLYAQVQQLILAHHAYEVPEIIQVPINDGLPAYLSWLRSECRE